MLVRHSNSSLTDKQISWSMISKWLHCTLRIIQPFVTYEPTVSHRKFTDDPVCRAFFQSKYYPTVLLHTQIKCTLQSVVCELGCSQRLCLCDVWFVSLPPPAGEWDPNRAGGTDISGAGSAAANRHRERRNWTIACWDRRYTKVRVHPLGNLLLIIKLVCIHLISVGSNVLVL